MYVGVPILSIIVPMALAMIQCAILLQVVLCFSPVGSTLRVRSRKFPAIVNCTSIDWFHEWPEEALISVSSRFLSEVELITVRQCPAVVYHC